MSLEAVAWALRQNPGDATAKLILLSLADHHNISTGECFPSKARLAEAGCCDARTVARKLAYLVEQGWIITKPRHASNGRQTSNSYVIIFDRKVGGQPVTLPLPGGGQPVIHEGDTALSPPSLNRNRNVKGAQAREAAADPATTRDRQQRSAELRTLARQVRAKGCGALDAQIPRGSAARAVPGRTAARGSPEGAGSAAPPANRQREVAALVADATRATAANLNHLEHGTGRRAEMLAGRVPRTPAQIDATGTIPNPTVKSR